VCGVERARTLRASRVPTTAKRAAPRAFTRSTRVEATNVRRHTRARHGRVARGVRVATATREERSIVARAHRVRRAAKDFVE